MPRVKRVRFGELQREPASTDAITSTAAIKPADPIGLPCLTEIPQEDAATVVPPSDTFEKAMSTDSEELPDGIADLVDLALTRYGRVHEYLRDPRPPGATRKGVVTIAEADYSHDLLGRILVALAAKVGLPSREATS